MSKLIEHIEQLDRPTPAPLGFGAAARQKPIPPLIVLGSCTPLEKAPALGQNPADGLLFTPEAVDAEALAQAASGLGDMPWGVRLHHGDWEAVNLLREKGCDFIAFLPSAVSLDALQGDEVGRLLVVTPDLAKEEANMLEDLPLDATLFSQTMPNELNVEKLLVLASQRSQIGKPFLLPVDRAPSPWELECLRDIGVEGLMLNLDVADVGELQTLRERVRELPRRKSRGERPAAYIPHVSFAGPSQPGQEEEPEEETLLDLR